MKSSSMFITFEGIDGCGKSTQVALLVERLRAAGHVVTQVREPGGTPAGEAIRAILKDPAVSLDPKAELLLFAAARAQIVSEVIRPALERGEVVICDRFIHSTFAYQGAGRGLDKGEIFSINHAATGGLLPDLTLFLDIPVEVSRERAAARGSLAADRFDGLGESFHKRVRASYDGYASCDPAVERIDACLSVQEIADEIFSRVSQRLAPSLSV